MNQNYKDVRATAQMQLTRRLATSQPLRAEDIHEVVQKAIEFFGCDDVDASLLVAELESSFQTIIGATRTLVGDDEGYEPWLSKRKAEIDWSFWSRYERYLVQEKGWAQATLEKLEEVSDHVLDLLTAPDRPGPWDRRGMVVGHVQSGKTANYVGLISKAADAGYKLIVVLAGFHKSLRSQTQIRLEEGFLGYNRGAALPSSGDSQLTRIGVGLIDPRPRADSITTRADDGDFKRQVAKTFAINPGGRPLLFVVKKNGSVLQNLLNWVKWAANATDDHGQPYVSGVPLLVIDDEADQGSIDTKEGAFNEDGTVDSEHAPSILNSRIRQLLNLFDQSAYVGYTATPFANIFIHEGAKTEAEGEDLFPKSFIVSLPTPSDYIGPAQVFGYDNDEGESISGLPIVRLVTDHAATLELQEDHGWMPPRHKSDHVPVHDGQDQIPDSLREALYAFVLVCAARAARGHHTAHNSMLIHVTRFTNVQNRIGEQIRRELHQMQRRVRYGDGDSPFVLTEELHTLWENDFSPTSAAIAAQRPSAFAQTSWDEVERYLEQAVLSITVREVNGQAGEVLDYINHEGTGLNVIAIGGDKLSRGLTLEGLSVSYFLRASRMYDTLMQMGRWFGYRPGYLDLCRLYTTPDLTEWYSHIAGASEELREDFNRMAASGGTPRDFGHRVESHPLMMVTSQVKMRHGTTIDVTFSGDVSETINFWRTRGKLEKNWKAGQHLIEEIERIGIKARRAGDSDDPASGGAWLWQDVSDGPVVEFLTAYQEHEASKKVKTKLLADYIRKEVQQERLTNWTILVASGQSEKTEKVGSVNVRLVERSWHLTTGREPDAATERDGLKRQNHYRIRRLVSPADEARDLSAAEIQRALDATIREWREEPKDRKEPKRPSGPQIRKVRPPTQGLLLLYPLDGRDDEKVEANAVGIPVLGFAISFPTVDPEKASKVQYVVNNVYYTQEFGSPNDDDEEWL
jgi:hypothetical protein